MLKSVLGAVTSSSKPDDSNRSHLLSMKAGRVRSSNSLMARGATSSLYFPGGTPSPGLSVPRLKEPSLAMFPWIITVLPPSMVASPITVPASRGVPSANRTFPLTGKRDWPQPAINTASRQAARPRLKRRMARDRNPLMGFAIWQVRSILGWNCLAVAAIGQQFQRGAGNRPAEAADTAVADGGLHDARMKAAELPVVRNAVVLGKDSSRGAAAQAKHGVAIGGSPNGAVGLGVVEMSRRRDVPGRRGTQ